MKNIFKQFYDKLTLKGFRDQLLDKQQQQIRLTELLFRQLFSENPVLVVGNVKMYLPLFYVDHIQRIIFETRDFYEAETLAYLQKQFNSFTGVIDIGSNIGNHVLYYCSGLRAEKVYCFEPNQFNREILEKNISLNHFKEIVTVFPYALGAGSGRGVQSNFSLGNTGMNKIDPIDTVSPTTVPLIDIRTLDSFELNNIQFIKIDVEGFEAAVLKGAKETITKNRPVILIEVFEKSREAVESLMNSYGYKPLLTLEEYNVLYVPV